MGKAARIRAKKRQEAQEAYMRHVSAVVPATSSEILKQKYKNLCDEANKRLSNGEKMDIVKQWAEQEERRIQSEINFRRRKI
jgi:hypothetical protein